MNSEQPFKWRHFLPEIILLNVRWYLRYPLSYRDLEEMMVERGFEVDHTTIYRWVMTYAPEMNKRYRKSSLVLYNLIGKYDRIRCIDTFVFDF